ncbi:hypothetical protein [Bacillus sp. V2I10]|uniref:hypothetical protein n=1 Tax=Bacillus sp. V2I10 TaxID=3042276 RepID=UPI002787117D|nr:hypothetical protein [Bacillus sp. V2I10]MDQ0862242.1 TctA family transporter [Bacillus sp. V2I10]
MWPIIGIVMAAVIMIIIDVPSTWKKGEKKELWGFFILLFIGVMLSIVHERNVNIPNPLDLISVMYKPFGEFLLRLLK